MFTEKMKAITSHGKERIIDLLRLVVTEYPRLMAGLLSKDEKKHRKTQLEVLFIDDLIEREVIAQGLEEKRAPHMVWREVFHPDNFRPVEWNILQEGFAAMKDNADLLAKGRSLKKKGPSGPRLKA
jgi:hypothetical protein